MPNNSAVSKSFFCLSVNPGIVSAITVHTANPMGKSIKVVEVFITHILISAETSIKPPISLAPLEPTARIIFKAILL